MEVPLFYLFSATAILSALFAILLPQPTRALLSLIITMFSLATIFIFLGASFVAMVQLIVYAGAVLVLFLFVIMLQGVGARDIPFQSRFSLPHTVISLLAGLALGGLLLAVISQHSFLNPVGIPGDIKLAAKTLFTDYLLPFELTSIILLLGVFAAVSLAKKEKT